MPGYRTLSAHLAGEAAEHAREAELLLRDGDSETAARLLEEALEASRIVRPEMPGWLCGRLASLYRTLKRYDDEVLLLERYRESQTSEEARTRFDARLSKARAIADRKRRADTGALETIRQVRRRSKQRRRTPAGSQVAVPATPAARRDVELRNALSAPSPSWLDELRVVLTRMCEQAHREDAPVEQLVARLKTEWIESPVPPCLSQEAWHERYSTALVELLAIHFGESGK